MLRLQLIHWNSAEAQARAATLQAAGYAVAYDLADSMALLQQLRNDPPAAIVIDLTRQPRQKTAGRHPNAHQPRQKTAGRHPNAHQPRQKTAGRHPNAHQPRQKTAGRHPNAHQPRQKTAGRHPNARQPSHGRDMALALRGYRNTRNVPLVLVEGDPQKVERIRELLPDATYTTWSRIRSTLKRAIAHPPAAPIVPRSRMEGYSGKPLAVKLGIRAGLTIDLEGAPAGFRELLGELPAGVSVRDGVKAGCDLALWFVRSCGELRSGMRGMAARLCDRPLWIIWPKQGSALAGDLTQQDVRDVGLAAGWVDYKVCSVDATWSGLLFRRRHRPRH